MEAISLEYMTTLNVHAQESKSRNPCLSASDPEHLTSGKKQKTNSEATYMEIKGTVAARPRGGGRRRFSGGRGPSGRSRDLTLEISSLMLEPHYIQ